MRRRSFGGTGSSWFITGHGPSSEAFGDALQRQHRPRNGAVNEYDPEDGQGKKEKYNKGDYYVHAAASPKC
jgi:hypothetical protein